MEWNGMAKDLIYYAFYSCG